MPDNTVHTLDMDAHYRVDGWGRGIAFYLLGYVLETEDRSRVRAVMVGDDEVHIVDVEDLHVIPEDGFCRGCGQIGCGCEVWS